MRSGAGAGGVSRRQFLAWLGMAVAPAAVAGHAMAKAALLSGRKLSVASRSPLIPRMNDARLLETPLSVLGESWITPNEHFFLLNRADPPSANDEAPIRITGLVERPSAFSVVELQERFQRTEVTAFLQCAGFGRRFYEPPINFRAREVPYLDWGHGAVGNARWGGVRLRDVLASAGLSPRARHVAFIGADATAAERDSFIRSIPMSKALDPHTLLASSMNAAPLPRRHGGPVRVIVPGWIGAYSIKWLREIVVLDQPWPGKWMTQSYRVPERATAPGADFDKVAMRPLTACSVKSIITSPHRSTLAAGRTRIAGFAWSGAGPVVAVDVSTNSGRTWREATLFHKDEPFAWQQWSLDWKATPGRHEVVARARDSAGRVQPLSQDNWNPGGYEWHAAHRITIDVS